MDKIDKIRQEIERRKVQYYEREMKAWDDNGEYGDEDCYFYQGKRKACEGLLCFIDTLSEEPDKSLEEEVKRYHSDNFAYISSDQPTLSILTNIARHFAEWQKEQMLKDAVEFECIGKKVKMTVKELIDYYINTECCEVAEECGF